MLQSKTFRLPLDIILYLSQTAKKQGISQGEVLKIIVKKELKKEAQWKSDLDIIRKDKKYQKESILMAEEFYE